MKQRIWLVGLATAAWASAAAVHVEGESARDAARRLVEAARAQGEATAAALVLPLDAGHRARVDYFPRHGQDPRGVRLSALSREGRARTGELLRHVLSEEGYLRVHAIRTLEDVLRASPLDGGDGRRSDAYEVRLFGLDDAPEELFGMQFEGHHLSVNAFFEEPADGPARARATPLFLGANPAEVLDGPHQGLRVLGPQQDLARELLGSLTDEQREAALVEVDRLRPLLAPGAPPAPPEPAGLPASQLDAAQRAKLGALIASYARHLRADLADEQLRRIADAGDEDLRFTWIGSTEPGEPHAYRVQGPTVLIEFDLIRDRPGPANHVHCQWRDPERDFGLDLLRQHAAAQHAGPPQAGRER